MKRIVVVGHGMSGARLISELHKRDPGLSVTVLGGERYATYNRILLTDVLAGLVDEEEIYSTGEENAHATVHSGVNAVAVDRERRTVIASDGGAHVYDSLVIATGSSPRIPRIDGLLSDDGELMPGIAVFRTLDDCRRIRRLAHGASRVLVLGGGLLGLETARALVDPDTEIEVLHSAGSVMNRQLTSEASEMLIDQLAGLGVTVRLDAAVTRTTTSAGRLTGVELADGRYVPGELLVVACGVRPETALAEVAGLPVGHGVIVDASMRTADPAVYAIGDCAEAAGTVSGLVDDAWAQAGIAADAIAGPLRRPAAGPPVVPTPVGPLPVVTRLKTEGIALTLIGDPHPQDGPHGDDIEVLSFADADRGIHRRVVLRDGRIIGAALLGEQRETAGILAFCAAGCVLSDEQKADLVQQPSADRTAPRGTGSDPEPPVCYCRSVTRRRILEAHSQGARTVAAVARKTRATTGCGICRSTVKQILKSAEGSAPASPALAGARRLLGL